MINEGHAEDLLEMIAEFGTTATVNGVDVEAIFTDLTTGSELEPGGFQDDFDASLIVTQADGAAVTVGDKVTVNSTDYRVMSIRKAMDNVSYEFKLQSTNK